MRALTPQNAKQSLVNRLKEIGAADFHRDNSRALRFEVPIESQNLLAWLSAQKNDTKFYFSGRCPGDVETAGIGFADLTGDIESLSYSSIFEHLYHSLSVEFPNLRYYGGFAFTHDHIDSDWSPFGAAKFFIPRFELFNRDHVSFLALNVILRNETRESLDYILSELEQLNFDPSSYHNTLNASSSSGGWISRTDSPDFEQWKKNITLAVNEIRDNLYKKTVLARKVVLDFKSNLDPSAVLLSLKKLLQAERYDFLFQFDGKSAFLGSSPERLYKRSGRHIESEAIAGTRSRGKMEHDDLLLANELMDSDKDRREHDFVVDSIESGLKRLCVSLDIDNQKSVLKLKEGQHLVSHVNGVLKDDVTDAILLETLHPTPAVGGLPIDRALDAINRFEPFKRGWYAGVIGSVGYDSCDFAVGLRSGLIRENHLSLFSGVGVVDGSNPDDEWRELDYKIGNFINIFENE